ncbi:MAG: hypothetical protein BGO70_10140 [Bacteroidetes bacterium 43-93]|nr:hypothetical protein [Bacteroidota bacterium]OJX00515.1 MAG: hypothetical protein BGO70_10140 [Bacteroidetes bacterium 43-93]
MENTTYQPNNSIYGFVLLSIISAIAAIYYAVNVSFNSGGFKPANWIVLSLLITTSVLFIAIAIRKDARTADGF